MPTLRLEGSLAAGAVDRNILAGSKFEMLPFPSTIKVFGVQDGADAGSLLMDLTMGSQVEIDAAAVPTFTAGLGPDTNKHQLGAGVAAMHDRLQIKLSNGDAVNTSAYRVLVDIRRVIV